MSQDTPRKLTWLEAGTTEYEVNGETLRFRDLPVQKLFELKQFTAPISHAILAYHAITLQNPSGMVDLALEDKEGKSRKVEVNPASSEALAAHRQNAEASIKSFIDSVKLEDMDIIYSIIESSCIDLPEGSLAEHQPGFNTLIQLIMGVMKAGSDQLTPLLKTWLGKKIPKKEWQAKKEEETEPTPQTEPGPPPGEEVPK